MEAIENSIAFLTEDRKKEGLCLGLSVEKNVNLASYPMISRSGIINLKKERQRAEEYRKALAIKTPSIQQLCKNLSGGNQQKVVIAKWLCRDSDVFIFDEPTVGVDARGYGIIGSDAGDVRRKIYGYCGKRSILYRRWSA